MTASVRFVDKWSFTILWLQGLFYILVANAHPTPTPSVLDIIVSGSPVCIHRIEVRLFTNYIKAKTLKSKEILTCMFMYALIEFKVKKKPVCCISFFQKKIRMNLTTSDVQSDEYYNHLYILCLTSLSRDHCGCAFSTS